MRAIALLLLLASCTGGSVVIGADAAPREHDAAEESADATIPNQADAAAGDAASRLAHRPLLGALPIENRWLDPMMDLGTFHWALDAIDGAATTYELYDRLRREAHPDVPTAAPVLHVRRLREGRIHLISEGLAAGQPLDARVWVGRRIDVAGDPPIVRVTGTTLEGLASAVDLVVTATVVARTSGVEWTRYEGRWDASPIGQVLLSIEDPLSGAEMFVSGPELLDVRR